MNADARELQLFIDNDADLHRSQYAPILKNLMTKHGQGRYNRALAVKLFMYLVDAGAKKYAKMHGSPGTPWHKMFPKPVRTKVAEALRDEFEEEAKLGNYDDMLPKKYKGKVSGKTIGEEQEPEGDVHSEDGALFDEGTRKALGEAAGDTLTEGSKTLAQAINSLHVAKGECHSALKGLGTARKATKEYGAYQEALVDLDKSISWAEKARKRLRGA